MFNFSHFHKTIFILVPKVCFFDASIHTKSEGELILNLTKVIVNVNSSDPSSPGSSRNFMIIFLFLKTRLVSTIIDQIVVFSRSRCESGYLRPVQGAFKTCTTCTFEPSI